MAVTRWDPLKEIGALERQIGELFDRWRRPGASGSPWAPAMDAYERDDELVVKVEVPGLRPEDVEVSVEDDTLCIRGAREEESSVEEGSFIRRERMSGRFERQVRLPPGADPEAVRASYDHGVLEVRVPKPKTVQTRRVPIQPAGTSPSP